MASTDHCNYKRAVLGSCVAILCRATLDGADIDPTSMEVEKEKPRNRMSNAHFTSLDKFRSCHDRMNLHREASRNPNAHASAQLHKMRQALHWVHFVFEENSIWGWDAANTFNELTRSIWQITLRTAMQELRWR